MSFDSNVTDGLSGLISGSMPAARNIDIRGLLRTSNGLSRENWAFDASWEDSSGSQTHKLMLMRDAAGSLLNTDRATEFGVLKALESTPVPSPAVHWVDLEGRWLGTPSIVMDRVEGDCEWMALNSSRPLEVRMSLARELIGLIAQIQLVDWDALSLGDLLGVPDTHPSVVALTFWESEFRDVQLEPLPEMEYALTWLRQNAPPSDATVLVHGDFKPGNALILNGKISALLDWETAHLGDPLEDLGWVTNPVRRSEHQISGYWEREQIVDAYQRATGRVVDENALLWWNVFSCWKLAVIGLTGVHEFVAGRYDRIFQTPSWLFRPMFHLMGDAA